MFIEYARGERPLDHLHLQSPPLPNPTTPFIGRKNELAQIVGRLANGHILSLPKGYKWGDKRATGRDTLPLDIYFSKQTGLIQAVRKQVLVTVRARYALAK